MSIRYAACSLRKAVSTQQVLEETFLAKDGGVHTQHGGSSRLLAALAGHSSCMSEQAALSAPHHLDNLDKNSVLHVWAGLETIG